MRNWRNIVVDPDTSIIEALKIIDHGALQIAIIADRQNKLLGTLTDGDIRRAILKGISLESSVALIMNRNPITASIHESKQNILARMKMKGLHHIPIVDDQGHLMNIELINDLILIEKKENWVILMAGGLGTRLSPLTDDCPKPLLKVGTRPILETIIEGFMEHGFHKFYLSINYRGDMIRDYFGDGSRWGIEIRYLEENKRLGTAGALTLLPPTIRNTLFVMNGDLLTKVNYHQLLEFHLHNGSRATMCVREYEFQIPYGVVDIRNQRLVGIAEKPMQKYFVSAGIYVLEPEVLKLLPKDQYYDMPSLFQDVINLGLETTAFPVREYWVDIGKMDDYERANKDYSEGYYT